VGRTVSANDGPFMNALTIGWIGAGVMGRPMAAHLMRAGHALIVVERANLGTTELLAMGASAAPNPRAVAQRADVVFTMLPSTELVEEIALGADGVRGGLRRAGLFIDMSSIAPKTARRIAHELEATGAHAIDAPVSGGEQGAIDATLSIMAGGSAAAFARAEPLFRHLGKLIVHVGPAGSGQVAKACNQVAVAITIEAVAEALALAEAAGADPGKVRQALMGGLAGSVILDRYGARMLENRYEPGARARLHRKDLAIASELAAAANLTLPASDLMLQRFDALIAQDGGDLDHSAVRTLLR
jgi:2-hydroxy-3-oxopropionate reductase